MGCYDFSCSLSHIPIHHGEPAVMLYLGTSAECAEFSKLRFGREWEPVSLPITGYYNDYGDIEGVDATDVGQAFLEGPLLQAFAHVTPRSAGAPAGLSAFKRNVQRGRQPYPDNWMGAWGRCRWKQEVEHNGSTSVELDKGNGTSVSKVFIHRALWELMRTMGPIRDAKKEVACFLEARRKCLLEWEPTPMEKSLLKALDANLESGDAEHFVRTFRNHGMLRETPVHSNELGRAMTCSPSFSEGNPLNYNTARLLLNAVDSFILDGEEVFAPLTIQACLESVCALINVYHGTRRINQNLEPVVHTTSTYQETSEALATLRFLEQAKAVQLEKLRRRFADGFDGDYDPDDPIGRQLTQLLPELALKNLHGGVPRC